MKNIVRLGLAFSLLTSVNAFALVDVTLGPRPLFLVADMDEGVLKQNLEKCLRGKPEKSAFSIGHRGAALMFPEHTKESYIAAAQMGAGILECDVTFTKDKELVCRHSQNDLHTTTDVLAHPDLAAKCSVPFIPANPATGEKAKVECRTSDFTLAEFKRLKGKMDGANPEAKTPKEYMDGTPGWRTDLYASRGTLMTHAESIALFKALDVKMTPELKAPVVSMPYDGFSQQDYAQKMIDEYKGAGIKPSDVYAQSFHLEDVKYWITSEPEFGEQAVFLDARMYKDRSWKPTLSGMKALKSVGVEFIAPPLFALVALSSDGKIVPSDYAQMAKQAGLGIITWTLERSGSLNGGGGWYYQSIKEVTNNDGDVFNLLDVLAQDVGVVGVFSDWPATTTFYANCMGIK
ncbi:glycerophosphodiester phosphodiesterase family protein [Grimontia marina]|uniref:glycerophosphodiester phosphodiesterase n=1 Tax=Grimontia marina TaxID=646534 RepID=A0A128FIL6_9GAMM|nr:glycerophosphodiester phosphodiesterase family protein [Grimontia marina]CZF86632.1 Glycerophosphoryl diester phosphodiesterase precursor [Grimontia marina]